MKTNHANRSPQGPKKGAKSKQHRRGMALVTVLTIMSLATIMVMTFFSLAQNEHKASSSYSEGLQAQQVAEQAVNMTIRQIRKATSNVGIPSGQTMAWASQPGAIRTWSMSGAFNAGYKLYSDDEMVVSDEDDLATKDFTDMSNWDQKPWAYVDLNEPVIRGQKVYYPIVDPSARDLPEWPGDLGDDDAGIEGFDWELESLAPGPMRDAVAQRQRDVLPMPAMWIYQLRDGTLGFLNESKAFQPLTEGGSEPEEENPIVARFAFWADDETCKLNPNTHAGGAAWATPFAGGDIDRNLGRFQPAQHEWQRYPGHSATTHLAPVLAPGIADITYDRDNMELIFGLVPRVVGGGSMSGTANVDEDDPKQRNGLIADKDRLYPSLDEFIMKPDRELNEFPAPGTRGRTQSKEYMQEHIERTKFFLSVVSRAPEVTVFNTPRVSIWPTYWDQAPGFIETQPGKPGHHTPFDRLIRFCAEIGSPSGSDDRYEYHFQRYNADSSTADYEEIDRNQQLLAYLEKLTRTPMPGAGGGVTGGGSGLSFDDKYPREERLQLLTEIFDYIRCTNLHDDTLFQQDWREAFVEGDNTDDHLTYTNPRRQGKRFRYTGDDDPRNERQYHKGHGQVTPIRIDYGEGSNTTKGMGRFYTMMEVGVWIICCGDGTPPATDFRDDPTLNDHGGGGNWRHANPGIHEYRVGEIEEANGSQFSNFPPLPPSIERGYPNGRPADPNDPNDQGADEWPDWLQALQGTNYLEEAFNPDNWNWQLAWLDKEYEKKMPDAKYLRSALSNAGLARDGGTRLDYGRDGITNQPTAEKAVQAALIFNMFTPSLGWVPINPDMEIDIQIEDDMHFKDARGEEVYFGWSEGNGVDLSGNITPNDTEPGPTAWASSRIARLGEDKGWSGGDRTYGGVKPAPYFMRTSRGSDEVPAALRHQQGRSTPVDMAWESDPAYKRYNYVTKPFRIQGNELKLEGPGMVRINIYAGGEGGVETEQTASQAPVQLVQHLEFEFDEFDAPGPELTHGHRGYINEFGRVGHWRHQPMGMWSMSKDGPNGRWENLDQRDGKRGKPVPGQVKNPNPNAGNIPAPWFDSMDRDSAWSGRIGRVWGLHNILRSGDVCKSMGIRHADARLVAARPVVLDSDNLFEPHYNYNENTRFAHNFVSTPGTRGSGASPDRAYDLVPADKVDKKDSRGLYHNNRRPYSMFSDKAEVANRFGDFDNGMGLAIDGAYINKPDEGNRHSMHSRIDHDIDGSEIGMWDLRRDYGPYPYFVRDYMHEAGTPSYFSPNRIISSPGMFGSLPVGTTMPWDDQIGQPWRTLLFRPNVTGAGTNNLYEVHPGGAGDHPANQGAGPPDHYFLDLFWMPVVEPYAISEPLSTGGKINMNYQILPFTNITRSTGMRGVFKSEYMLCVPNRYAWHYKIGVGRGGSPPRPGYHWRDSPFGGALNTKSLRSIILEDETLVQFQRRFDQNRIFRTASEICDIHLVPEEIIKRMNFGGASASIGTYTPELEDMENGQYWADHAVVGDNSRERPYSNIYTRLTTKSNTFKVHYRAQVVKQASPPGRDYSRWDEALDTKIAEYRGSTIVERYVEPNDPDIPDYATEIVSGEDDEIPVTTIDEFYKYRVVNPTRFAP